MQLLFICYHLYSAIQPAMRVFLVEHIPHAWLFKTGFLTNFLHGFVIMIRKLLII